MSKLDLTSLTVGGIAPSFLSVEHAAQLMDVSHWTVRRWITNGHLDARKMPSGGLRIAVADLEQIGEQARPDRHGNGAA
ncbi:helix-turn-helix domain-containing protein [Mycobacterium sp. DL99]|uniref:helix-turn-helix domain-containing protein n=1 Tax=Mycobacterium sp. DL99 TaxID=2528957 RepID=UPI001080A03C|nr:helix-turn-helix domain-containing protein [Mycobacterium sp. DL99]